MKSLLWLVGTVLALLMPSVAYAVPPNFIQGGNSFGVPAVLGTNDNFDLIFETNNVERVRIDTNGYVGIGTTAPISALHIMNGVLTVGDPANTPFYTEIGASGGGVMNSLSLAESLDIGYPLSGGGWTLRADPNSNGLFVSSGTPAAVIFEDSNVGIGTNSPEAKLHVAGGGTSDIIFEGIGDLFVLGTANVSITDGGGFRFLDSSGTVEWFNLNSQSPGVLTLDPPGSDINIIPAGDHLQIHPMPGLGTADLDLSLLTTLRTFSFPDQSGTFSLLQADQIFTGLNRFESTANTTIYVGSSVKSGCLVLGDSDGVGVTYITANDGVLTASTVKPAICD
jgi:hypothetical protein